MRTPAWEDADLRYRPAPYEIDGTRRVRAYGDQTLLSWARPTPWFTPWASAVSYVGAGGAGEAQDGSGDRTLGGDRPSVLRRGTGTGLAELHRLRDLVDRHDQFWLGLSPLPDPAARAWVEQNWRPWSTRWHAAEDAGAFFRSDFTVSAALLSEIAGGLSALREEASARGIPIPDLGSLRQGFLRPGWDSQRDAAYQAALRRPGLELPVLSSGTDLSLGPTSDAAALPARAATSIDDFRRAARLAVARPPALGQAYADIAAVGFLQWHDRQWVTPFPSFQRARAYFDRAQAIGIDFDYGAYFDVSDPEHPVLIWEQIGAPSIVSGVWGAPGAVSPPIADPRYAADAGALMSEPLIGRHGAMRAAAPPMHAHPYFHHRRFADEPSGPDGWGDEYGAPSPDPRWAWGPYGALAYPGTPTGDLPGGDAAEAEDFAVSSGALSPPVPPGRRDDLRDAADVMSPGRAGLTCELNLGPDLILRGSICVDGRCYQGALDLSRRIADLHARLHGWDVTGEVVGRSGGHPRHRHHRHHHHPHHHRPQDQDQDQDSGGQEGQGAQGAQGGGGGGYPYPYPPPSPQVPLVVAPTTTPASPDDAGAPPYGRRRRGSGGSGDNGGGDGPPPQTPQEVVKASGEVLIGALYQRHCREISAGWLDSIGDAFSAGYHAVAQTIQKFKGPITTAASAVATAYGGPSAGQLAGQLAGPVIDAAAGSGDKKEQARQVVAIAQQAAQRQPQIAQALSAAQTAAAQTAAAYHVTSTAIDALRGNAVAMTKVDQLRQDAYGGDPAARRALDLITLALQSLSSGPSAGGSAPAPDPSVSGAGFLPWLGLGAAAGAGYWWWHSHRAAQERARQEAARASDLAAASMPPRAPASSSATRTTTSGEIELAKADAVAAVRAASQRAPGILYYGYVRQRSTGGPPETSPGVRVVVSDTSVVEPLLTREDLDRWYHETVADPAGYEFVAMFDAASQAWPLPFYAHEAPANPGRVVAPGPGPLDPGQIGCVSTGAYDPHDPYGWTGWAA